MPIPFIGRFLPKRCKTRLVKTEHIKVEVLIDLLYRRHVILLLTSISLIKTDFTKSPLKELGMTNKQIDIVYSTLLQITQLTSGYN